MIKKIYEVEGTLLIQLEEGNSINNKQVRTAIEKKLEEFGLFLAVVINLEGESEVVHRPDKASLESLMSEAPILEGRSRKSRSISAQNMD